MKKRHLSLFARESPQTILITFSRKIKKNQENVIFLLDFYLFQQQILIHFVSNLYL